MNAAGHDTAIAPSTEGAVIMMVVQSVLERLGHVVKLVTDSQCKEVGTKKGQFKSLFLFTLLMQRNQSFSECYYFCDDVHLILLYYVFLLVLCICMYKDCKTIKKDFPERDNKF